MQHLSLFLLQYFVLFITVSAIIRSRQYGSDIKVFIENTLIYGTFNRYKFAFLTLLTVQPIHVFHIINRSNVGFEGIISKASFTLVKLL
jgi:hypothetical protein